MSAFSFDRLVAVFRKEVRQFMRDRLSFGIVLSVPIIELVLFGYAINPDARRVPALLVDLSRDRFSRAVVASLETSDYFRIANPTADFFSAEREITRGAAPFVVTIPSDFGRLLLRGEKAKVLVEADVSDPAAFGGAMSALNQSIDVALSREAGAQPPAAKHEVVVHRRFNPDGESQFNIVPGLLGVILEMTMMMTTGLALTREAERGTMENLLAMPVTATELMIGKITPYLLIGLFQLGLVLSASQLLFSVPMVGSLGLLLATSVAFILSMVLLGYTFSTFVKTQMQATQVIFFYFLPSLLLSGFMFPFSGMPAWAQSLGEMFPLTHFMRIIRGVMLRGADLGALSGEISVLAVFSLVFSAAAILRFRSTLD